MKNLMSIAVILVTIAIIQSAPTNSAPKPVVRVLSEEEIAASNTKTGTKAGKRIRNNSRFEGESKVELLKINTLDQAAQKMISHPGQQVRPAPGAYPVYYGAAFVNGKFGKAIRSFTTDEFERYNLLQFI